MVSSTATHCVEDEDGAELGEAVQGHVSKETEGGDQRTSALSAQTWRENVLFLFLPLKTLCHTHDWFDWFSKTSSIFTLLMPTSSPDEQWHTADVFSLGSEG